MPPAWTTYVWVDDADAVAASAVNAGGSLLAEPFGSIDGGRMAIVADPAGAVFGVWTPGAHRGAQRVNEPSAYAMSFLRTPDPGGAIVWVTALSALALARSSQARPGHPLFVRGDCPLGDARHAELVGGGARLLEEPVALG
jgi:uncharacterized protein